VIWVGWLIERSGRKYRSALLIASSRDHSMHTYLLAAWLAAQGTRNSMESQSSLSSHPLHASCSPLKLGSNPINFSYSPSGSTRLIHSNTLATTKSP
jgi:hypothetical protein